MRILVLANMFPLPADNGGALRVLAVLEALAADHEVTILVVLRPGAKADAAGRLAERVGARVEGFAPGPAPRSIALWAQALRLGVPPWMLARRRPALAARAAALATGRDLVVVLDDYAGVYARDVGPAVPLLADKHHVFGHSLVRDAPPELRLAARARQRLHATLARRFERRLAQRAAETVVTSTVERARFADLYGPARVSVMPGAVTLHPPRPRRPGAPLRVGWIGSAGDALIGGGVLRFVREGWPALAARGLELHLAGWDRDGRLASVAGTPGVHVHGYVEDARAFLERLDVGVVPVWGGAGVRLKTLEMLAVPLPVVATPDAVEGLAVRHDEHVLLAGDPAGLAAQVARLTDEDGLVERLTAAGRPFVEDGHTWVRMTPRFLDAARRATAATS